ncbi:M56 family metallopeptidase [Abyssalbus ytuae]|uniref:M56 family metallopeptidase n=1 Tax=Abyssalbus ytuae TaxID=2926907 RepID=A0A9E7CYK5_9FLAO|nr:M56 family metallopeptidase [Abyssalbus ytuae]UOB16750.1 M56 family metallopeptidase [Abyssalbus ytuae]
MEIFFIYILKSSFILSLFYITYKLWLQKETFFTLNRYYLLTGIFISVILPLITITRRVNTEIILNNIEEFNNVTQGIILPDNKINFLKLLLILYISGTIVFLLRFCIQVLSFIKLVRNEKPYKESRYKYVKTNKNTSPFSFLNYIVYNPNLHTIEDLKTILEHEKTHCSHRHSIDILTAHVINIFFWINPFSWLYKKAITQNLEYLADKYTSEKMFSNKDYQYLLLKKNLSEYNLSITNTFFNLLIKKRIVMLNKTRSQKQNLFKYGIIIPVLTVFFLSFNVKTVAQTIVVKEKKLNQNGVEISANTLEFVITKNNTDEELKNLSQTIKSKYDGEFKYSNPKRNSKGEITDISVTYKSSENSFVSSSFSDTTNGIPTIIFGKNEDDGLFITSGDKNKIKNIDVDVQIDDNEEEDIIVKKIILSDTYDNKSNNVRVEGIEGNPLYYLNGKRIDKKKFEEISVSPEKIISVNVLKGKKAIKEYGKKAKDGVIKITTKE